MTNKIQTFIANSLNVCRYQFFAEGENIAVQVSWEHEPSQPDLDEVNAHITAEIESDGEIAESVGYTMHGHKDDGALGRSIQSIDSFLKTGDPGVKTTKFK